MTDSDIFSIPAHKLEVALTSKPDSDKPEKMSLLLDVLFPHANAVVTVDFTFDKRDDVNSLIDQLYNVRDLLWEDG